MIRFSLFFVFALALFFLYFLELLNSFKRKREALKYLGEKQEFILDIHEELLKKTVKKIAALIFFFVIIVIWRL